jgi:hypothetical protein
MQKISKFELVVLARVKNFLQIILPVKPSEEEFVNKAVIRILVSLLNVRSDLDSLFSGRSMVEFKFSSMGLLKELNGVLAYWLSEEQSMNKHIKVMLDNIDHWQYAG